MLLPLLPQFAALRTRQLPQRFVVFTRDPALRGRQLRPRLHTGLQALLFIGLHFRVTVGDSDPLFAARGVEAVPIRRQRREHSLLLW